MAEGVLHVVKRLRSAGGMGTLLREHLARGEPVISVMAEEPLGPGHVSLQATPNTLWRVVEGRLRQVLAQRPAPPLVVYHNCWGSDALRFSDGAERRLGYVHTSYPQFDRWLTAYARHVDGFVFPNRAQMEALRERQPWLPLGRCFYQPYPVHPPAEVWERRAEERPCVIGYAGRLERTQKRLDRLPDFLGALVEGGLDFQMEILGEGPDEPWLRERLGAFRNVQFLGWQEGSAYWERLRRWRYGIFLSDYEGLPVALLEQVAAGVEPVYPDFYQGRDWLATVEPQLLYPPGQPEAAARVVLEREAERNNASRSAYVDASAQALHEHRAGVPVQHWEQSLNSARALRSVPRLRRSFTLSLLPLWAYNRLYTYRAFGRWLS